MRLVERLMEPFVRFAQAHLASGDIDPMYPVLRQLYAAEHLPPAIALWRSLLYVTWYHAGSAEHAWTLVPEPPRASAVRERLAGFVGSRPATGVERRAFRGGNTASLTHLHLALRCAEPHGGLVGWVRVLTDTPGEQGWARVRGAFQALPFGGNWSSYKWADLLAHVHGYPITADDIGVGGGGATAGPIPGMVALTGHPWQVCAADVGLQRELLAEAHARGVPFSGLDQLETALCDFNSLLRGRYYVGHDIDVQQEQLDGLPPAWWKARARAFAPRYLGEVAGWSGVRPHFKRAFLDRGELVNL